VKSRTLAASLSLAFSLLSLCGAARADVVTDWNDMACAITAKAGGGATGHRLMAIVQVSVHDAVSAIDGKYKPHVSRVAAPAGASVEAAVAAANRAALAALLPAEKATIEAAYQAAIAKIPEGAAKADGIAVGEKAAAAVLARAEKDAHGAPESYQPHAAPGVYVPTMIPVFSTWPKRTPWVLSRPDQFRPGPPPALDSDTWAKDLQEVKAYGGRTSLQRTPAQTDIARFWEETRPMIYHGVVRSVATMPGRSVADNARLFATASVAVDDALIAVFDAKYHYNFWRPVTAIRNGHLATRGGTAEPGWTPFINTPMHPEYPCAHCVSSGAVGAVLEAELGKAPVKLSTKSPTANDVAREWTSIGDFTEEVKMARIYDGVHYRTSTVVGNELGRKVGLLAAEKFGR
jgi:hypothetical protein